MRTKRWKVIRHSISTARIKITVKWAGTVCLARENERQRIPEKGLPDTHKRLELPQLNGGFDELYYVIINDAQDCIIQEWNHEI